ncbi:acyl-CoA reductase-like NAD-dependent aldehyde dehydrogenase [Neobacillus niacini]|uniref:aldehyde dehydrogenase family protein n=1 Tax=Neobacillus niacini TaxID=86668 RepID=UPI002854DB0E|nr:aldehyde dehydrogenase family protein [Neobacillus niacini]MDR7079843.1 acyl-CoA reductase-like NAD-dependent aldehyde dehydrogenase [Neobacillus niacini]
MKILEIYWLDHEAGEGDIDKAVTSAKAAFKGPWSQFSPAERSRLINKLADLIEEHQDELTYLETIDFGSIESLSRYGWVLGAAEHFRYYAGWATKLNGETMTLTTGGNKHAYSIRQTIGVCGQIASWNFPILGPAWKLAPALAAGNTSVLKPSQFTSLSTLYLGELIKEAGFPDGVANIVTGPGSTTGEAITGHPDVDKVIERGNLTEYGLASGVHTRDINKAHKVINALEAGTVWVNGYYNSNSAVPLAGFKQSGIGAEMGYPGIEIFTKAKSVVIDLD